MFVLGAGFGRTGTLTLKVALERLGFRPCYHMVEVEANVEHAKLWAMAADAPTLGWEPILAGYSAAVDWPAAYFWRQILARHPGARVILTVRDPASWYASLRATVLDRVLGPAPPEGTAVRVLYDLSRNIVVERTFGNRAHEEAHAIDVFRAHNRAVMQAVAPERLLVYEVTEGWSPLCRFLSRSEPGEPFPHLNDRTQFVTRYSSVGDRRTRRRQET